jgi:hypothetical protein
LHHYREIVTPDEANRYWLIAPPAPAANGIAMAS